MKYCTQKDNIPNCGAIAVLNLFKILEIKHNYSVNSLTKILKTNYEGCKINDIHAIIDKKNPYFSRIYNPSFSLIK